MKVWTGAAVVSASAMLLVCPARPAVADDGSTAVVTRMGLDSVAEISHNARWVKGSERLSAATIREVILDRETGAKTPDASGEPRWFIRDNPTLRLNRDPSDEIYAYPDTATYLINVATGTRKRIDTDSRGTPLKPSWSGLDHYDTEYDSFYDSPQLLISAASVSRDGRKAAFCTNYETPRKPLLYVKDLKTGHLTRTRVLCGVAWDETTQFRRAPEMSDDGRVVHVNGDQFRVPTGGDTTHWLADTLYFTGSGKVRKVNGWGSMTRDGGTVFMRVGVRPPDTDDRTGGRVGAYNVRTRRITPLPGTNTIYGNDAFTFLASDKASRRGRFVVNDTTVIDRTYGITVDITAMLREQGYEPYGVGWYIGPLISGDGTTVVLPTVSPVMQSEATAVTGWEPRAHATATPNTDQSKLLVDIDPDQAKGYWTFKVQRERAEGSWQTLKKTYRTHGIAETRTINLPAGTYRVLVNPKFGHQGVTTSEVTLIM